MMVWVVVIVKLDRKQYVMNCRLFINVNIKNQIIFCSLKNEYDKIALSHHWQRKYFLLLHSKEMMQVRFKVKLFWKTYLLSWHIKFHSWICSISNVGCRTKIFPHIHNIIIYCVVKSHPFLLFTQSIPYVCLLHPELHNERLTSSSALFSVFVFLSFYSSFFYYSKKKRRRTR